MARAGQKGYHHRTEINKKVKCTWGPCGDFSLREAEWLRFGDCVGFWSLSSVHWVEHHVDLVAHAWWHSCDSSVSWFVKCHP